jgi:hypothetical protein
MNDIDQLLSEEIKLNKKENWNKLDKTAKITRLNNFALSYCQKNQLIVDNEILTPDSAEIVKTLRVFLKSKLNQKRLLTTKDVIYDVDKQSISSIPCLVYVNNTFVLKRNDKRTSTVKSLTPTKKN